jgi:hypothetical protein
MRTEPKHLASPVTPVAPCVDAAVFLDDLRNAWGQAAASTGVQTRRFRLAGAALELRFAGDALIEPLTRALAHLPVPDRGAETLVVRAWETRTTGVDVPAAPWSADDYLQHGRIRGFFGERFQTVFQWGSRSLLMLDVEQSEAVFWVGASEQIPYWERAAPLRVGLHGWLQARGVELVHAAAVGSDDGCVLLVGKGGSGKSWTSLAAVTGGLRFLGDDYCLITPGAPARVASVYSAAKTHPDAHDRLPFLGGMVSNPVRPDGDKAVYFLHEHVADNLLLEAELRAILIPRRGPAARAALKPASPAAAVAALAPSTILQLPAADGRMLERLAGIVRGIPCYVLDLGTELDTLAPAIASVLKR